ncbi:substrate-binding domain-containing protein [Nocardia sp. NPDC051463]|uniref:sugar ABC transporter substrate-binding protein n=1 Tax=Nocardia sp. NPDC051463 TaxID=3154845 RepID=UPI00344C04B7
MWHHKTRAAAAATLAALILVSVVACSGDRSTSGGRHSQGSFEVGVILPDTQSSPRYEEQDRPLLQKVFDTAGVTVDIQNAQGDKAKFATIADAMIQEGVRVLIVDGLDSPSAAAVEQRAKAAGVTTIDYDRLTLGGSASYYVSFDNVEVGQLMGKGLVSCLGSNSSARIIEVNGSPTDNNATLFKQGYDQVLNQRYAAGWSKVGDQSIPGWDNATAGASFEQMLSAAGGKVDGVLAAWDSGAQAIITVLKKNGLEVPITGDDATVPGLQSILRGDQCVTVYKSVRKEAAAAAQLSIALIKNLPAPPTVELKDPQTGRMVPSVLLSADAITKASVKDVIADGGADYSKVCTGDVSALCEAAGITR